ncbi:MAG: hypothetical protein M3304_10495, partial [Actinomycetota bacterium]|nr:hypothetical protein [Actinomycetota bacterium]
MGLSLVVGPANAGKVALLLDQYVEATDRDPVLVVPNGPDVERIQRDLLERSPALLGGSIGTFDDLFEQILRRRTDNRRRIGESQRRLLLTRVARSAALNGLAASSRFPGFTDALGGAIVDVQSALLEPDDLAGPLADLLARYRMELDRLGLADREGERALAAELVATDLAAWDGRPVFAYGFEDLTGVQWRLVHALAGRTDVTVSLPYAPGRPAFASLARTADDLAALADGRVHELLARDWYDAPALPHLERALFADRPAVTDPPALGGAVRFLEAAGSRGTLELVAEEILDLLRGGTRPETIGVVCPSLERWRSSIETVFGTLGVPYDLEGHVRLPETPFGRALLALLRFAWLGGGRRELYAFLRSPYSGFGRTNVDFLEGRLRGRAVERGDRTEEETVRLRDGQPIPALETLRTGPPLDAV